MKRGTQVVVSVVLGWSLYLVILVVWFMSFFEGSQTMFSGFFWNIKLFVAFAGNGPLLGYDGNGNPIYEGTPVHLVFLALGILSGFAIYPFFVFVMLMLLNKFGIRINNR